MNKLDRKAGRSSGPNVNLVHPDPVEFLQRIDPAPQPLDLVQGLAPQRKLSFVRHSIVMEVGKPLQQIRHVHHSPRFWMRVGGYYWYRSPIMGPQIPHYAPPVTPTPSHQFQVSNAD